jgi:probable HAF family extracellular repeat protein
MFGCHHGTVAAVVVAMIGAAVAQPQVTPVAGYTMLSLGVGVTPYGINKAGQVVGTMTTAPGESHAFLWSRTNGLVDLGTLGGANSEATAINSAGDVVGWSLRLDGTRHAFQFTHGVMADLGTLGGTDSVATAINERSQIVGYSTQANGSRHAFFIDHAIMVDLGTAPGSTDSAAYGINNSGLIVGCSGEGFGCAPVQWQGGKHVISVLPNFPYATFDAFSTSANGVNEAGVIVGEIFNAFVDPGFPVVVTWDRSGVSTANQYGLSAGIGSAINDEGAVVGTRFFHFDFDKAFVADGGILIDLFPEYGVSSIAFAINNAGQIVGLAVRVTGGSSETVAFLLAPDKK